MTKTIPPASLDEFHAKLVEISDKLPKKLRLCADYIAKNTEKIAFFTVVDLAEAAAVQPSALIRFCQIMGYSGYTQMQRVFRDGYTQRWPDYSTRLEKLRAIGDDSPSALLADFVDAGRSSLEKLASSIEPDLLESAVSALTNGRMIHIIGLGRAFPVSTYFSYALQKMDIPAMLHGKVGNLDQRQAIRSGDVLFSITFADYSRETLDLSEFAIAQGNQVVAITDALNSPLHAMGALALTVSESDVESFRVLSAPLSLAITLAVSVGARRNSAIFGK